MTIARSAGGIPPRQLDGIQILRAVAAASVVFHHFCLTLLRYHGTSRIAAYRSVAAVGASGVDIFFCISGFIITYSLLARREALGWRAFAIARIKRIVPLYWLFTILLTLLCAAHLALRNLHLTPMLVLKSLLLLPLTKVSTGEPISTHPILDQGWTLQYEALFYLICTIVIAIGGSRRLFPWTAIGVALAAGAALLIPVLPAYWRDPLLLEFMLGTAIGWAAVRGHLDRLTSVRWPAIGVGGLAITASLFLGDPESRRVLVWGLPGGLLVLGCAMARPSRDYPVVRFAVFLGAASYSIYLTHSLFTLALGTLMKAGHFAGAGDGFLLIGTIATTGLSALVYLAVERPITRLIR